MSPFEIAVALMTAVAALLAAGLIAIHLLFPSKPADDDHTYGDTTGWPK